MTVGFIKEITLALISTEVRKSEITLALISTVTPETVEFIFCSQGLPLWREKCEI